MTLYLTLAITMRLFVFIPLKSLFPEKRRNINNGKLNVIECMYSGLHTLKDKVNKNTDI